MKKLLLLCLAAMLCACSHKAAPLPELGGEGDQAWTEMREISARHAGRPGRLQISLRFGKEGDTRRVTGVLWGQNDDLRLDVMAGVGAILAKIQDRGDRFLLYEPRENRAFEHVGANKPLLRVGTPLPFDLGQLAALLMGDYARVFGESGALIGKDGELYEYEPASGGRLLLSESGLPEQWSDGPWKMALAYGADGQTPRSIRLSNADGSMAALLVKEREQPEKPFTAEQMELELPPGAVIAPLSQYNANS